LSPGTWKDLYCALLALTAPPVFIVTSRLADERLWAEALNVGVYDVLAKPLETSEVNRSLSLAALHCPGETHFIKPKAAAARRI
jgi:DNA-binding response OmpR family regulator